MIGPHVVSGRRFVRQALHPSTSADDVSVLAFCLRPRAAQDAWRLSTRMLRTATSCERVGRLHLARAVLLDVIEAHQGEAFPAWLVAAAEEEAAEEEAGVPARRCSTEGPWGTSGRSCWCATSMIGSW